MSWGLELFEEMSGGWFMRTRPSSIWWGGSWWWRIRRWLFILFWCRTIYWGHLLLGRWWLWWIIEQSRCSFSRCSCRVSALMIWAVYFWSSRSCQMPSAQHWAWFWISWESAWWAGECGCRWRFSFRWFRVVWRGRWVWVGVSWVWVGVGSFNCIFFCWFTFGFRVSWRSFWTSFTLWTRAILVRWILTRLTSLWLIATFWLKISGLRDP